MSEQQVSSNDKLSYPIKEIKAEHLQNKLVDLRYLNYKKKIVFKDLKRINFKKLNSNYDFKWQRNVLGVHRFESSIFFDQKAQHLMCDSLQGICQMGNVVIFQDKNLACKTSTNCPSGKFCLQGKCVDKKKDCPIYQTRMSLCNGPEIKLHFAGEGLTSSQVKSQLDKILPTFFSVYPYNEIKDCFTITYSSQNKKEEDSCNYQNADVAVFLRPQFGRSATEKGSNTIVLFLFHQSHPGYVLAHELGHAIASLSDEYYEEAQSPIAGLNCLPIKPVEAFSSAEDVWAKYGFSGLADKAVKNNWVGCGYLPSRLKDKFIRPSQNSIMNDINGQNGHEFNALSKKILQQKIRERFK
ncbi:hypothetical protein D6777_00015 [Candidatus Woesearchaeota archaeon]|nr:MAG: hypothetical protein D6777_00015 [Candidatus Woesearchaeota archaeon]